MKTASVLGLSCLFILTFGCGLNYQSKKDNQEQKITLSELIQNSEIQSVFIAEQNQELTEHLAEQSGSVANFALSPGKSRGDDSTGGENSAAGGIIQPSSVSEKSKEKSRTCTASSESNKVTISLSRSFSGETTSKKGAKSRGSSDELTRVWDHPSADLACSNKHLDFDAIAGNEAGLKNITNFSRTMSMSSTKKDLTRSREVKKEGQRTVEYLTNSSTEDASGMKEFSIKVNGSTKKVISTAKDGVSASASSSTKTTDLLVEVKRNSGSWSQKLVKSGTIVSEIDNGAKLTYSFENVLFKKSETKDSCEPVSGSISGTLESTGETKSFKVIFSEDQISTTVNDVPSELEFDFGGCDFGKAL